MIYYRKSADELGGVAKKSIPFDEVSFIISGTAPPLLTDESNWIKIMRYVADDVIVCKCKKISFSKKLKEK